ncbi:amidophosphoribosyltransferase [Candidatus Uhrbacteria bacterium CG_4_9_14_3_um_filter_50_9]|uniref:Amidophosphoribosyltransferase n=1 Tax=Candidatus Uhrbacteria bacterium CG_4_9_14_3_um_filter_50_9 TaxID=1975035 RepID=A0A2M7XBP9_9BACT|nr:MAG: amidophosphoribosyltransferase [Candidatus Uhrbacteria bacterium CG_4_9_14_3_um_filter_50_9]
MPEPLSARCPFCHRLGSDRVCGACRSEVYLDGVSALAPYGNPVVRKALQTWKYDGDREIEKVLQQWLTAGAAHITPPLAPFHACAVPLHEGKQRQRGFDQADVVAQWASGLYGIPHTSLLVRKTKTASQAKRAGGSRQVGELDGVFHIRRDVAVPEHVLLCDDVFTSGATIDAAARTLKEAGAKQVWGWVIARGR